jgi:predicted nucleic acid-binding protein
MYLIDTNVISEQRKKNKVNPGVGHFFKQLIAEEKQAYISVITLGELRRGVELIRHRGDEVQARFLEKWLLSILNEYADSILDFTAEESQVWGRLRIPHHENALDKQIAATALIYDLTLVTRNVNDFAGTGVKLLNPFS